MCRAFFNTFNDFLYIVLFQGTNVPRYSGGPPQALTSYKGQRQPAMTSPAGLVGTQYRPAATGWQPQGYPPTQQTYRYTAPPLQTYAYTQPQHTTTVSKTISRLDYSF